MVLWKEIEGYENYHVFEDGRVWSCKRKGRFMKPSPNTENGYLHVNFNSKTKSIHRLVGEAFIPNPENKPQIDHIDRNRTNNHVSNLRWATHEENMDNIGEYKNNTTGHKNISYNKFQNRWMFNKCIHRVKTQKYFNTLEDSLIFKIKFEIFNRLKLKQTK